MNNLINIDELRCIELHDQPLNNLHLDFITREIKIKTTASESDNYIDFYILFTGVKNLNISEIILKEDHDTGFSYIDIEICTLDVSEIGKKIFHAQFIFLTGHGLPIVCLSFDFMESFKCTAD